VAVARGRTWAGTIFGASRLLPGGKRWKNYQVGQGLSQNHVYRLLDDGHDLWASCINGGLARFDERLDRWVAVPQDHGIGNKYTYAMALDGTDGSFWLGTAGGVNRYDPHRGWDVVVCESGFTDYSVYAIHRSGDTLWFGTTYGLYRRDLKAGTQRVLGRAAGLPGDDVVALAASPDILYVATRTGVSTIPLR
jgi:ligand-binding sensor domain-containing protein